MEEEKIDKLWHDDNNWGHGRMGVYFCKEDPRLIVPKRGLPGGTFNMAHRHAVTLLTAIIVGLIVLVLLFAFGAAFGRG